MSSPAAAALDAGKGQVMKGTGKGKGSESVQDSKVHNILWPHMVKSEAQLEALRKLPFKAGDVMVATYPKCGTHWVHKICTLIQEGHGLFFPMEFNPWDVVDGFQGKGEGKGNLRLEDIPSPRAFGTHVPFDFLPQALLDLNCPIVYVMRNPMDALVSYYHHSISNPDSVTPDSLEAFVTEFISGASSDRMVAFEGGAPYGGLVDHYRQYVEAAKKGRNIFLTSYEKLMASTHDEIKRMAKFLGKDLSDSQVEAIVEQSSFKSMKSAAEEKAGADTASIFFRKGERGSGDKELPPELSEKVAKAFDEPLADLAKEFWKL